MIEIQFLGGAEEVGRMGILLNTRKERFLFDYGISVQNMAHPIEPELPIDGMCLAHPHLDHSGHVPSLYKRGYRGSVWATPACLDLSELLLKDSLKVQIKKGLTPNYLAPHLNKMMDMSREAFFREPINFKESQITFYNAGHVPGSASLLLRSQGKGILYTSDVNFKETFLMPGAFTDYKDLDVLICETTYSHKNHPDRKKLADKLQEMVQYTVYNNGTVLVPSFAVGRTQEMLCILHGLGFPIYLDGMGIEATRRVLNHPDSIRVPNKLKQAFNSAHKVTKAKDRKKALSKPCIIIATAGMMQGGPVNIYMKKLHKRENCLLVINGYQVEGTPGRTLLDTGRYVYGQLDIKPKMRVEFMDFSAHCGREGLIDFIKKTNPKKIFLVHGERTHEFSLELREMDFDAIAPKNGERFTV